MSSLPNLLLPAQFVYKRLKNPPHIFLKNSEVRTWKFELGTWNYEPGTWIKFIGIRLMNPLEAIRRTTYEVVCVYR